MIPTTTMGLPKPESGDLMEPFFLGSQPDGGYWMTVERLSEHDHTGGALGKTLTGATIPDGSITTSKLDPSVLAPYALTDGSKPFSGPVTMQADAVVRDAVRFGEQGTTLAPDATLARTGVASLRLDTRLGLGVTPGAWTAVALQVVDGALWGVAGSLGAYLTSNTVFDGARKAVVAGAGTEVALDVPGSSLTVSTAPSVGAGATQTFTARLALAPAGTLTVTPTAGTAAVVAQGGGSVQLNNPPTTASFDLAFREDAPGGGDRLSVRSNGTQRAYWGATGTLALTPAAATAALSWAAGGGLLDQPGGANPRVQATGAANLELHGNGGYVHPSVDGLINFGAPSKKWATVYAATGTINTSLAEAKTDITPLDPAAALAAVLATDPVRFIYTAPAPTAEQYELPDDPEQAEQVLHQRLVNAPLMEAARSQAGFVLHDETGGYQTDPLFETGFGQSNSANTAGVLLAAVHELARRLEVLEGA